MGWGVGGDDVVREARGPVTLASSWRRLMKYTYLANLGKFRGAGDDAISYTSTWWCWCWGGGGAVGLCVGGGGLRDLTWDKPKNYN